MSAKEEVEVLQSGKNNFKTFGPLCVSEGFYQHRGECWSDTIQMAMLYTDGIKEFTQPKLAFTDVEYKDIEVIFEPTVNKLLSEFELVSNESNNYKIKNLRAIFIYFKAVQERFRRHYRAEVERFKKIGPIQCYSFEKMGQEALDFLIEVSKKYRSDVPTIEKPGIVSAVMSMKKKEFVKANREDLIKSLPKTGSNIENIKYVISLYNKYFKLRIGQNLNDNLKGKLNSSANCHFLLLKYIEGNSLHLSCFLQCGNKEYYYDDNEGIYLFPYKKFLKEYNKIQSTLAENHKLKIIFISKLYIKDKKQKIQGAYIIRNYPFLSIAMEEQTKYITFIDNKPDAFTFLIDNNDLSKITKEIEVEDQLYSFVFSQNRIDYELLKMLSIVNTVKNENKPTYEMGSGFNIQTGKYLGSRLQKFMNPLQLAMLAKDKNAIINLIQEKKFNLQAKNINEDSLLHIAIYLKDDEFFEFLLTQPNININAKNAQGDTPFHLAIKKNLFDFANDLLEKGSDPRIENNDKINPIQTIIAKINEYTISSFSPYKIAVDEMYLLLDYIAKMYNLISYFKENLYRVAIYENLRLFNFFIKYGLNINEPFNDEGDIILHISIETDNLPLFLFLLENGADPEVKNKNGKTPKEVIIIKYDKYPSDRMIWLNTLEGFIHTVVKSNGNANGKTNGNANGKTNGNANGKTNGNGKTNEPKNKTEGGGKFSHTRKNLRTKKRKTRKNF